MTELLRSAHISVQETADWQSFVNAAKDTGKASGDPAAITIAAVDKGLILPEQKLIMVTEAQLLGRKVAQRRRRRKAQDNTDFIIKSLSELRPGAAVVHLDHGVGRYVGLQTLTIENEQAEFLTLEYSNQAKLYVPVANLHLISRYGGTDPEAGTAGHTGQRYLAEKQAQGSRKNPRRRR